MKKLVIALALLPAAASSQNTGVYRGPIIDVHLHAQTRERLAQPAPNPATGEMSPKTAEEHMARSLAIMKDRNVVLGIVSGSSVAAAEAWDAAAPDRILKGISVEDPPRSCSRRSWIDCFGKSGWMRSERWRPSTQATLLRIRRSMRIGRLPRSTACR